ncbi:MAG: hypothetical protein ACOYL6_14025 [Bacteriovoracaceae bacterium]
MIFILPFLLIFSSCGSFIKRIDEQQNNFVTIPQVEKTYCAPTNHKLILMNSEPTSQAEFERMIKDRGYSPVEQFVLWSLVQMAGRPDVNSPESQFEVFVDGPKSTRYFRFTLEQYKYPMIEGLAVILKSYSAKRTLRELIQRMESDFPSLAVIDNDLEIFINKYEEAIKLNPALKEVFMRAGETLKAGEKFKRNSYLKLLPLIPKTEENATSIPLLANEQSKVPLTCNFSLQSYDESLYSVQEKINPNYTFGLSNDTFTFMASTSLAFKTVETLPGLIWLKADPDSHHGRFDVAACLYEDPINKKKMALLSTDSRDPGQHLYHLFQYDMGKIKSAQEMDSLLKFSRHLFLTDPLRLIYESHRGTEKQLTELLKLNIPIYNANLLGHITIFLHTPEEKTFILDNRHKASLTCH